ncbi:MAG: S8 family serine peptidase [Gemmatimonadota bacterium]|nr:S8 family serine peptidase [Gemmatimonadota bacterium]
MKRWVPFAVVAFAVTACQDASGPGSQVRSVAQKIVSASRSGPISGSYIIKFRDDMNGQDIENSARSLVKLHAGSLKHVYKSALKGFAVENLSAAAASALANDPRVEFIEQDQVMSAITTQTGATWGLDRVDQRALPLDRSYTYYVDGTGVTVYIIDTGINFTHPDFEGRASKGIDEITANGTAADCNGHGTHVSGTVGGKTYGLAKKVKLVAVRVLDCSGSGTSSGVIAGIDWVTANRVLPAAANMSLGGGKDVLLNQAVARSVAAGVTYAVAAGNSTADACNSSPSSEPSAITVGATDNTDTFAYFSNYGPCVDINAPGVNVTSDWLGTGTNTISGTSMASPHVTGGAALYLSANPSATPAQVSSALTSNATTGVIKSIPGSTANLLLYTAFIAAPPPGPPAAPSLSSPANGATGVSTSPTLSWSASSGATSYVVEVSTNASFSPVTYTATVTGTSAVVSPALANSTQYYWHVKATNTYGASLFSAPWSFTTVAPGAVPAAPALSSPADLATGVSTSPTLSWSASSGATSYVVQVSTNAGFSPVTYTATVTGTSAVVSPALANNTKYYWRVNATNAYGTSAWSVTRSFTTTAAPAPCSNGNCQN